MDIADEECFTFQRKSYLCMKNKYFSAYTRNSLTAILLFLVLFTYVILRAYLLSFTHDESVSFSILVGNDAQRDTANNHVLNTLLMSCSRAIFGSSEWALRLPNILSFVLYFSASFFVVKKIQKNSLHLFGLIMILFHPFLLEFFFAGKRIWLVFGIYDGEPLFSYQK